ACDGVGERTVSVVDPTREREARAGLRVAVITLREHDVLTRGGKLAGTGARAAHGPRAGARGSLVVAAGVVHESPVAQANGPRGRLKPEIRRRGPVDPVAHVRERMTSGQRRTAVRRVDEARELIHIRQAPLSLRRS